MPEFIAQVRTPGMSCASCGSLFPYLAPASVCGQCSLKLAGTREDWQDIEARWAVSLSSLAADPASYCTEAASMLDVRKGVCPDGQP